MEISKTFKTAIVACLLAFGFTGCKDNIDPLVEELSLNRALTPTGLTARIRTLTTIELTWNTRADVSHYVVEFSEDNLAFNTIIHTAEVTANQLPYQHTFAGETQYSARVKAVGEGVEDSNWTAVTITTAPENIFILPVPESDITANEATLRWTPGGVATQLVANPGNIIHDITAGEIAAGAATITGLTGETNYTVKLMNGTKSRGTATFTTLIDLGGATAINPGDNIVSILNAAADGAAFVIFPGTYELGSYALTKSVKLSGYLSSNKPIINGQLTCGATVASVELKSLIFRGNSGTPLAQFFNTVAGCNLTTLSIDDCEISHYTNNFIYNNASGTYGTISIKNCYVHDITGTGGDGLDFRGGVLGTLSVEKSTFANGFRTFLRMQVASNVSFKNNTFYKVCIGTIDGNNAGLFRMSNASSTFEVSGCLFVETGRADAVTLVNGGVWTRTTNMAVASPVYANNNIFNCFNIFAGLYTTAAQVSATELNPNFVDAATGNFKVTNQTIIDNNIGDPRWLQ
jgi:hypothetical protein